MSIKLIKEDVGVTFDGDHYKDEEGVVLEEVEVWKITPSKIKKDSIITNTISWGYKNRENCWTLEDYQEDSTEDEPLFIFEDEIGFIQCKPCSKEAYIELGFREVDEFPTEPEVKCESIDYSSLEDVFDRFKKVDLELTRLYSLEDKLEEEQEKLKRFEEFSCSSDKTEELKKKIINLDKEIDKGFDDIEEIIPWNIFDLIVEYKEKYDVSNPYDLVYHLTTDEIKTITSG